MHSNSWLTATVYCSLCHRDFPSRFSHCPNYHSPTHRGSRPFLRPYQGLPRQPLRHRYGLEGTVSSRGYEERHRSQESGYGQQGWILSQDPLTALLQSEFGEVQIHQRPSFQHLSSLFPSRQAQILQFLFHSLDLTDLPATASFWGQSPDFSQVLTHMTSLRPDRVHPASQSSRKHLQTVTVSSEMERKGELCAICQEKYRANEQGSRLPCGHLFHRECLEPWLLTHSTCPVCRLDLQ